MKESLIFTVKLEEYAEGVTAFEEALELAREQNDRPAVDAINKAIQDVRGKILHAEAHDKGTHPNDIFLQRKVCV